MSSFLKAIDSLPKLVKILLAIPLLDIIWVVYRLALSIEKKSTLGIVLAVILIIVGIPFLWLVDIITLIVDDKVLWFE